jgi:hypothetical protein
MPPKTFTCEVCEVEVSKPKSLAFGKGRACRFHTGVEDAAKHQHAIEKHELKKSIESNSNKFKKKEHPNLPTEVPKYSCWRCGCEGTDEATFYFQRAVAMEKINLLGSEFNFLDLPNQLHKLTPPEYQTPIIVLAIKDHHNVIEKLKYKHRIIADLSGVVCLCPSCLKDLNLLTEWEEERQIRMKKINLETMYMLGDLMKPALQEEAINQLNNM